MKSKVLVASIIVVLLVIAGVILSSERGGTNPANEDLIIASIIPLTGPAAEFGEYNREASEMFVDPYNRKNPDGRQIRHTFQDSESTGKGGINAIRAIFAISEPKAVQVQLSSVSMAVAPVAAEKGVPLFTIAGSGGPKQLHKYAYRNYPDPTVTARATANAFLSERPDARVGLLRINDEFGMAVGKAFQNRLSEIGALLVSDETYEKSGTDFRAQVTKVLASKPEIVYLVGFGNPLGRLIVQLRELGFKGQILGGPEIAFADVLATAKEAAEGVRFIDLAYDANASVEPTRSFVQEYESRYERTPTAVAAVVYDGWSLLLRAFDEAGSTNPLHVTTALNSATTFRGVCGSLSINSDRDVIYPLTRKVIQNGKAVTAN